MVEDRRSSLPILSVCIFHTATQQPRHSPRRPGLLTLGARLAGPPLFVLEPRLLGACSVCVARLQCSDVGPQPADQTSEQNIRRMRLFSSKIPTSMQKKSVSGAVIGLYGRRPCRPRYFVKMPEAMSQIS